MISSKHSHTFAQFWLAARHKNRPEIVSKTASLLQALQNGPKNIIFSISGRLGFRTGSNMGPQNWPKINPKPGKIVWKSLQAYETIPKCRESFPGRSQMYNNVETCAATIQTARSAICQDSYKLVRNNRMLSSFFFPRQPV